MREAKVTINEQKLDQAAELMRALTHPLRLRILAFIDENGSINVNRIYNTLKLEQSITSQHLRILRLAKLVHTERVGKYIHYRVNYEQVQQTLQAIGRYQERIRGSKGSAS